MAEVKRSTLVSALKSSIIDVDSIFPSLATCPSEIAELRDKWKAALAALEAGEELTIIP